MAVVNVVAVCSFIVSDIFILCSFITFILHNLSFAFFIRCIALLPISGHILFLRQYRHPHLFYPYYYICAYCNTWLFNCKGEPYLYYTQDKELFRQPERAALSYLQIGKIQASLKLAAVQMQCQESNLGCRNPLSYHIISIFSSLCLLASSVDTNTLPSHFPYFLPANCGHLHCMECTGR